MKEKILVVDDDKSMVNMIKDVLEMEGYAVTTAFDGEQALKQVQKQSDIRFSGSRRAETVHHFYMV